MATDANEPEPIDEAARVAYLRERGVEISFPSDRAEGKEKPCESEDKGLKNNSESKCFRFVFVPSDVNVDVKELTGEVSEKDVLPTLLAPLFADDALMDSDTVTRETASKLKNMVMSKNCGTLKAPSAEQIQRMSAGGVCEAYPLFRYPNNGLGTCVRLYIDEVGALRNRPRNSRAESLATAAGLHGLSIHGDAYVGRCSRDPAREVNIDFPLEDLAHSSKWVQEAFCAHKQAAAQQGHGDTEHLASGGGDQYKWSQTDDDVEVRVHTGIANTSGVAKRFKVNYGRGDRLAVLLDGKSFLDLAPLFDRVIPDECTWTIDGSDLVVTLQKDGERSWAELLLPQAA